MQDAAAAVVEGVREEGFELGLGVVVVILREKSFLCVSGLINAFFGTLHQI